MLDDMQTSIPNPIYSLASNDNPKTVITHVTLRGPNYEEWAKGFRVSLGAKRKLGFVDGTVRQPELGSAILDDWWTVNYMIVAWIFNTIDPTICSTNSYRNTARELCEDIQQRFSLGNDVKIYQLKSEIADCKQNNGESIMDFYERLKKLWDDVNNFDALPSCLCSGCKYGLTTVLRTRREADQVHEFLMGLETHYATVRSRLLGLEPLPSHHVVYSRLIQKEVRLLMNRRAEASATLAFAVRGNGSKGRKLEGLQLYGHS